MEIGTACLTTIAEVQNLILGREECVDEKTTRLDCYIRKTTRVGQEGRQEIYPQESVKFGTN